MQDSPLKVRKTRENLRQDVAQLSETKVKLVPHVPGNGGPENVRPLQSRVRRSVEHQSNTATLSSSLSTNSVTSLEESRRSAIVMQPATRRQSVRKSVVSRVKEGILSRSKSTSKASNNAGVLNSGEEPGIRSSEVKASTADPHHTRNQSGRNPIVPGSAVETVENIPSSNKEKHKEDALRNAPICYDSDQASRVTPKVSPGCNDGLSKVTLRQGTPPQSCSPSPDQTPRPARRPTRLLPEPEVCRRPEILHVALSIVPAVAAVDMHVGSDAWVKIEAEAKIDTPVAKTESGVEGAVDNGHSSYHAIDLIVIIDNSFVAQSGHVGMVYTANSSKCSSIRSISTGSLRHPSTHLQLLACT